MHIYSLLLISFWWFPYHSHQVAKQQQGKEKLLGGRGKELTGLQSWHVHKAQPRPHCDVSTEAEPKVAPPLARHHNDVAGRAWASHVALSVVSLYVAIWGRHLLLPPVPLNLRACKAGASQSSNSCPLSAGWMQILELHHGLPLASLNCVLSADYAKCKEVTGCWFPDRCYTLQGYRILDISRRQEPTQCHGLLGGSLCSGLE